LIVEHFARIAQSTETEASLFESFIAAWQAARFLIAFVLIALARKSADKVQHVKLDRRMAEKMGEVPESLTVLEAKPAPVATYSPELTLFAEQPALHG
jgi:hypothetical protein